MTSAITAVIDNLLTGEENLRPSPPGWSGRPQPCSGPIAISVSSYAAAGKGVKQHFAGWVR
jgi:hypothetical protein